MGGVNYHVHVVSVAELQMAEAALWWATHRDAEQAARWLREFDAAITNLAVNPQQHSLAREDDAFDFDLRQLLFGLGGKITHRALFRITSDTVTVRGIYLYPISPRLDEKGTRPRRLPIAGNCHHRDIRAKRLLLRTPCHVATCNDFHCHHLVEASGES